MSKKVFKLQVLELKSSVVQSDFRGTQQVEFDEKNQVNDDIKNRGQWSKGIEFILSCIAMSVGLGNVWRFPHVAYENGGGAFLIPYLLLLFVIGRPMYYMELVLGQFSSRGPIKVWKCVPAFKGVGLAQLISTAYLTIFYNYLMALTLYYLFASFSKTLPWSECNPEWNPNYNICSTANNETADFRDIRFAGDDDGIKYDNKSASELYWLLVVLRKSSGLADINWMSWKLALCLVGSWTLVYLSIIKGVSSLGKVAYFTAIFPYTVLITLLVVALNTDGAMDGIKYFFTPQWEKLLDPIVWYRAVEQSFFSLAVCFGSLIMFSSYNQFNNNVYRDAIIISVLDTFTSLLAGCVIFSVLGTMAKEKGREIDQIVEGGMGLAFVVYPEALSKIKYVPQLWSVLFFIMLFTLGIGSSVAQIETILTSIRDEFVFLQRKKGVLAFVVCSIFCILGLPLTTDAGSYIMTLLDNYGVGTAVFFYGISQTVAIFWIYGLKRFCSDIKFMLNQTVGIFWKVTWGFTAPVALIVIFIYGNVKLLTDPEPHDETGIPSWGTGIGWALAALAVVQIPLWICVTIVKQPGSLRQKIIRAFSPAPDWGPIDPKTFQQWVSYNNANTNGFQSHVNAAFTLDDITVVSATKVDN